MTDDHVFPSHAAERYLLGEMTAEDREAYEAHFFGCAVCADDVRTTAAFLDDARAHLAPRRRLQPVAAWRPRFWPLPAGAAAAAALLLAVIGYQAIHMAALRRELASEQRLQSVPSYFLAASRGEGPTIHASSRDRKIALTFSQSLDRLFPFYRCEVRDAAGRVVASAVVEAPASGDELQVLIPADRLTPGGYAVDVAGLESATAARSPSEPAHYQFTLRRDP